VRERVSERERARESEGERKKERARKRSHERERERERERHQTGAIQYKALHVSSCLDAFVAVLAYVPK